MPDSLTSKPSSWVLLSGLTGFLSRHRLLPRAGSPAFVSLLQELGKVARFGNADAVRVNGDQIEFRFRYVYSHPGSAESRAEHLADLARRVSPISWRETRSAVPGFGEGFEYAFAANVDDLRRNGFKSAVDSMLALAALDVPLAPPLAHVCWQDQHLVSAPLTDRQSQTDSVLYDRASLGCADEIDFLVKDRGANPDALVGHLTARQVAALNGHQAVLDAFARCCPAPVAPLPSHSRAAHAAER